MPRARICFFYALLFTLPRISSSTLAQDSSKTAETVYEVHKAGEYGITSPKPISSPNPEYTDEARRKKINGTVLLSIVVGLDGKVRDAEVKRSLDKGLDNQAIQTVEKWTFQPATKDGQPVAVRIQVEMTFRVR